MLGFNGYIPAREHRIPDERKTQEVNEIVEQILPLIEHIQNIIRQTDISKKVDKSGDTMTGALKMQGSTPLIFGNKFKMAFNDDLQCLEIEVL